MLGRAVYCWELYVDKRELKEILSKGKGKQKRHKKIAPEKILSEK